MRAALLTLLAALLAATPRPAETAPAGGPRAIEIDLGAGAGAHRWGRWGADASLDLFVLGPGELRIFEAAAGGWPASPSTRVPLPAPVGLIDFGDLEGDRGDEILFLDRRGIHLASRPAAGGGEVSFRRALALAGIQVPPAACRAPVAHDLTGDGIPEILAPVREGYRLCRRTPGGIEAGILLASTAEVTVEPGGPDVLDGLRTRIVIPRLGVRDLDGDGQADISARSGDAIRLYLQGTDGLPAEPSRELDLSRFQEEAAEGARPGARGSSVRAREADLDGDGIPDYLVASGRTIRVYFGARGGPDFSRPHTMLKHSSALRAVAGLDIDGDRRLDLVAVKLDLPGLPRLLAAWFIPMTLDLEVLGYLNGGNRRFSRRPDRRATFSIELPPLRRIAEDFDAIAERFLASASRRGRLGSGDVDGDGRRDPLFLDDDGVLRVWLSRAGDPDPEDPQVGGMLFSSRKTTWTLDEVIDLIGNAGLAAARAAVADRRADLEIPVGTGWDVAALSVEAPDLDGDGRGDPSIRWSPTSLRVVLGARPPR